MEARARQECCLYSDTESTECHFKSCKIVELFVVTETELEYHIGSSSMEFIRLKGGMWENRKFWKLRVLRRVSVEMIKWHDCD